MEGGGEEVKGRLPGPLLPLQASQETKVASFQYAPDPPYEPPFWCYEKCALGTDHLPRCSHMDSDGTVCPFVVFLRPEPLVQVDASIAKSFFFIGH